MTGQVFGHEAWSPVLEHHTNYLLDELVCFTLYLVVICSDLSWSGVHNIYIV